MYEHIHAYIPDADKERFIVGARLLGKGGMGKVHEGFDLKAFQPRAFKWREVGTHALFDKEIAYADQLGSACHDFFAKLHAVVESCEPQAESVLKPQYDWTHKVMVMDKIAGETALTFFQKRENASGHLIRQFARRLLRALETCHDQGIIHCDLSPDNIMVEAAQKKGRKKHYLKGLKIIDFGLAHSLTEIIDPRVVSGKPMYIPPEAAETASVTAARDLFSVGVILAATCGGRLPVIGSDASDHESARRYWKNNKDTYNPRDYVPQNADQEVQRVVERCLQRMPEDRYKNAREALSDLA